MMDPLLPVTLVDLIRHYSPTGQETPAVDYLLNRMKDLGFTQSWKDKAGNAIGVMGKGIRQVILLGHIDTVPGRIEVRQEGDILYGRGSVDAKGSLAAYVDAVAGLGARDGWQFVVVGAVEEEGDSKGARFILDQLNPEFVIVGEPSRWDRITLGYKGSIWVEIHFEQPLFHTAGKGMSTCEMAFEFWSKIQSWSDEYNQNRKGHFTQVQPTLRALYSGEQEFSEWAKIRVGVRLPEDLSPESLLDIFKTINPDASIKMTGYPMPAFVSGKNNALVRSFLHAIRMYGGKPNFVYKSGTADFNVAGPAWKCPMVAYGPGDSALDHTPREHISIIEYNQSVNVLREALDKLAS